MAYIDKTYISNYKQYREVADWAKSIGTVTDKYGNSLTPYNWIPHIIEYNDDYSESYDKGEWTEEYVNNWLETIKAEHIENYGTEKQWELFCSFDEEDKKKYDTYEKWLEHVKEWKAEIPLWSTGHVEDIWLIRNCPIDFIQERLKEQYSGGWNKAVLVVGEESFTLYDAIKNETSIFDTFDRKGIKNPKFKIINKPYNINFKDNNIKWFIDVHGIGVDYDSNLNKWFFYEECHNNTSTSLIHDGTCRIYYGNMNKHRIRRILSNWELPKGTRLSFTGLYNRNYVKNFEVVIK